MCKGCFGTSSNAAASMCCRAGGDVEREQWPSGCWSADTICITRSRHHGITPILPRLPLLRALGVQERALSGSERESEGETPRFHPQPLAWGPGVLLLPLSSNFRQQKKEAIPDAMLIVLSTLCQLLNTKAMAGRDRKDGESATNKQTASQPAS